MKHSSLAKTGGKLLKQREPFLLVGAPGIGKTDAIIALAAEGNAEPLLFHPVVDDPTDYKGMPAVVDRAPGVKGAEFLPFGNLWDLINAKRPTLAFFDDIGQAPPAVQAALMQLVLARKINGHAVSPHVTFAAATNRRQDKAAVTGLITPLLDRFITVLELEFDLPDWINWALTHDMPAPLVGFARFKPDLIGKFEPSKDMKKSPTPRSVAGLGRLINLEIDDLEVLAGAVGEGFASEFLAFYRTYLELPDPAEIHMNPKSTPVPKKADVLYALMGSLAYAAKEPNFEATMVYLDRCPKEFAVLCVKDAVQRKNKLAKTQAFIKWSTANQDVML